MSEDKRLNSIISKIEKSLGKDKIMTLGSNPNREYNVISSGSLSLNKALGINGYPKGRIVEIYGAESSGKTTLCIHAIAECQKLGGIACIVDAEHAFDPEYAKSIGVNIDNLLISQPDCGEESLEIVDNLVKTNEVDLIIIDSVAALIPRSELEGNMGDSSMGVQARLMSQAMRKLTAIINKTKTCVIFINQVRDKIGVIYGSPEVTTGGKALKFAASIRLRIKRSSKLEKTGETYGNKTIVEVVKNKCAAPFKKAEFDILYGVGIDYHGEILDLAVEQNVIDKKGAWYKFDGENIGQGKDSTRNLLKDNPELLDLIISKLKI